MKKLLSLLLAAVLLLFALAPAMAEEKKTFSFTMDEFKPHFEAWLRSYSYAPETALEWIQEDDLTVAWIDDVSLFGVSQNEKQEIEFVTTMIRFTDSWLADEEDFWIYCKENYPMMTELLMWAVLSAELDASNQLIANQTASDAAGEKAALQAAAENNDRSALLREAGISEDQLFELFNVAYSALGIWNESFTETVYGCQCTFGLDYADGKGSFDFIIAP